MICVISGYPMFGQPPSPGLADLAAELRTTCNSTKLVELAWNQTPPDPIFEPLTEPVLLVGHSFGGCSAVMLSRHLEGVSNLVHLILIDPVRHQHDDRLYPIPLHDDPLAQYGGKQFDRGPNWVSAIAYLRTQWTWLPPYHQGLGQGTGDANVQIPNSDHNTIIRSPVVWNPILKKASALFP